MTINIHFLEDNIWMYIYENYMENGNNYSYGYFRYKVYIFLAVTTGKYDLIILRVK